MRGPGRRPAAMAVAGGWWGLACALVGMVVGGAAGSRAALSTPLLRPEPLPIAVAVALLAIGALLLLWRLRRLRALAENAERIADGESPHADEGSRGALGRLGRALNAIVARRRRIEGDLRRVTVAHDALVDAARVGIVSIDLEGNVLTWNPAAERLFGWLRQDVVGHPLPIVPPERQGEFADLQRSWDRGEARVLETLRRRKDGSLVDVRVSAAPIYVDGAFFGGMAVFEDITERRRAEEERGRRVAAEAARVEAEKSARRMRRIQASTEAAIAGLPPEEVLGRVLLEVRDAVGGDVALAMLMDEDGRTLVTRASTGLPDEGAPICTPIDAGLAGCVTSSEGPTALDELPANDAAWEPLRAAGVRALLCAPLRVRGDLRGILLVGALGPRRFAADDLAVLRIVAERVALVLEHTRLSHSERRMKAMLEVMAEAGVTLAALQASPLDLGQTLQTIAEQARNVVGADYAALGLGTDPTRSFDPWVQSGVAPEVRAAIGRPPRPIGLLGLVVRTGRPERTPDTIHHPAYLGLPPHHPPMGPFLGIPIPDHGITAGHLYLARKPGAAPFSEDEQRVIELFAAYAGAAYENRRLYRALLRERSRLGLLADASASLAGSLDPDETLARVAHAAVPALSDACVVGIVDEHSHVALVTAACSDPALEPLLASLVDGYRRTRTLPRYAGEVFRTGRTIHLRETPDEIIDELLGREGPFAALRPLYRGARILVPLAARGRTIGVAAFLSRQVGRFDSDDVALAEDIGRRAALSMENANLYREARRAVRAR